MSKFLTFAIFLISFGALAQGRTVLLDAHLHYWPEHDQFLNIKEEPCREVYEDVLVAGKSSRVKVIGCGEEDKNAEDDFSYRAFLDQKDVKTAFLISPSFEISAKADKNDSPDTWVNDEAMIPLMNQQVSRLTQKHPGRFIGFCGLNYSWSVNDASERVSQCLKLPGMKGIKIHFHANENKEFLKEEMAKEVVDKTLKTVKDVKPIILWHLDGQSAEEITFVYAMAKKYPDITFILAHSMYEPRAVEFLLELEGKNRLPNLYLETSASEYEKMMSSWRLFGLDRLLFGSDNMLNASEKLRAHFSQDEMELIGNQNPSSILGLNDSGRESLSKHDLLLKKKDFSGHKAVAY